MGSRNNPYIYMKQSDVYIQTSKYEGLCIAVGEAKVLCKPIIVVDIQGLREYIDNEINGLITERNPVQIADAVEKMDLRKRIEFSKQLGQIDWSKNDTMLKFYELIEEKDR